MFCQGRHESWIRSELMLSARKHNNSVLSKAECWVYKMWSLRFRWSIVLYFVVRTPVPSFSLVNSICHVLKKMGGKNLSRTTSYCLTVCLREGRATWQQMDALFFNHSMRFFSPPPVESQLFAIPWTVACQTPLSTGKNSGVGCCSLLQEIFPTQGSNLHLMCLLSW